MESYTTGIPASSMGLLVPSMTSLSPSYELKARSLGWKKVSRPIRLKHDLIVFSDVVLQKSASAPIQQTNAPWGLSRLSSSTPLSVGRNFDPKNTTFSYTFPTTSGSGVDIYVVDSGVHTAHSDFGGRATFLASFGNGVKGDDKDGHGTHVAGTAGGEFFGVAKKASIFAVKVLDDQGSGPISDIISGLNVVSQRVANQTSATNTTSGPSNTPQAIAIPVPGGQIVKRVVVNVNNFTLLNQLPNSLNTSSPIDTGAATGPRPSVVNLSLGGSGHSNSLDAAVKALVAQGIVMVIAAGNDGVEIGDASPADVAEAITVGAMDVRDAVPSFSNFGCVLFRRFTFTLLTQLQCQG